MDMDRARNYLSNHEKIASKGDEILKEEMLEFQRQAFVASRKHK